MNSPTIHELGEQLGIAFSDPDAIREAFVHASFANENPGLVSGNNERLEFLGDAVLGVIVSRILFARFPDADEGALTAHRAALVNRSSLASVAEELHLDQHLLLGRGEVEAGGSHRPSLLAAVLEALIGAIYLQSGLETVEAAFGPILTARMAPATEGNAPKSAKSRLQEWSQRQRGTRPMYELLEATGPAHAQEFTVAVVVASDRLGTGRGSSRQRAEEKAAEAAMAVLDERSGNAGARA